MKRSKRFLPAYVRFVFGTLMDRNGVVGAIIGCVMFAVGIVTSDFLSWAGIVIFVASLLFALCGAYKSCFAFPFLNILFNRPPADFQLTTSCDVRVAIANCRASGVERDSGFDPLTMSNGDVVLVSPRVNHLCRAAGAGIRCRMGGASARVRDLLQGEADLFKKVLLYKAVGGMGRFYNEGKIGLAESVCEKSFEPGSVLGLYRSDYFTTYLLAELSLSDVEIRHGRGSSWMTVRDGLSHYPCGADGKCFLCIEDARANAVHLGGNVLVVTADGKLCLWRQSLQANRSGGTLAPSGSGSADLEDFVKDDTAGEGDLLSVARACMEREFREEASLGRNESIGLRTKIIGYYRWMSKGGLPGFFGVARCTCSYCELYPESDEVEAVSSNRLQLAYDARTLEGLANSVDMLLRDAKLGKLKLSTPLEMNLILLKEVLSEDPASLDFLLHDDFDKGDGR